MNTKAVHFVYLGNSLPKYAKASLDLAVRFSGLEVHLLGNSEIKSDVNSKAVKFTAIEDFYTREEFLRVSPQILSDKSFRDGFWLKTLERFFVLEQYFKLAQPQDLYHAELDQLLFRNDILLSKLDSLQNRGLFFPFHSRKEGIASVFYCNNHDSLRALIDFSSVNVFENEMTLLADWSSKSPENVFALPTLSSVIGASSKEYSNKVNEVPHKDLGGIVDAAQLGQWVGGIDPRNIPISEIPKTKFFDNGGERRLSIEQLQKLEFKLDRNNGCLYLNYDYKIPIVVYNLHLHSKAHKPLSRTNASIYEFFKWANSNEAHRLPGTRKVQLLTHARSRLKFFLEGPGRFATGARRRICRLLDPRHLT
jgi:hypothetical protein